MTAFMADQENNILIMYIIHLLESLATTFKTTYVQSYPTQVPQGEELEINDSWAMNRTCAYESFDGFDLLHCIYFIT